MMAVPPKSGRSLLRRIRREENTRIPKRDIFSLVDKKDSAYLVSISSDEEGEVNTFNLYIGRFHINIELPPFLRPYRTGVLVRRLTRKTWRYVTAPRRFSIGYIPSESILVITYGRQSGNNPALGKDKFKIVTMPWKAFRLTQYTVLDKFSNVCKDVKFSYKDNVTRKDFPKVNFNLCDMMEFEAVDGFGVPIKGRCCVEVQTWENGIHFLSRGLLKGKKIVSRTLVVLLSSGEDLEGNPSIDETDAMELFDRETMREALERFGRIRSQNPAKHRQLNIELVSELD